MTPTKHFLHRKFHLVQTWQWNICVHVEDFFRYRNARNTLQRTRKLRMVSMLPLDTVGSKHVYKNEGNVSTCHLFLYLFLLHLLPWLLSFKQTHYNPSSIFEIWCCANCFHFLLSPVLAWPLQAAPPLPPLRLSHLPPLPRLLPADLAATRPPAATAMSL